MTDKKLLHLLDQNPEEGMGLLMEQYMGLLWSACHLYLTNPEDIRECVQETFADFYGNRERFRTEKGTIKAYLYVIAKRKAIRMAAQNGKQSMVPLEMLEEADRREFITAGTNQLLKLPEFRDADKAHQLMSVLADDKEKLPVPDEGPMKILIGPENVSDALKDTSVVVASYDIGDDMRGLIGVVGPTRMDYAAVAARLTGFADGLTKLFGKQEKQELPPKEDADT